MKKRIEKEIQEVCEESDEHETRFLSLKDLKVKMIDCSDNPYKTICNMALCTWGEYNDKWSKLSPESRFYVVKEVLEGRALPLALESPAFSFSVENCSRAMFDQVARARIGIVFASKGNKDNDLNHVDYIIPSRIKDKKLLKIIKSHNKNNKTVYKMIQEKNIPNWAARCSVGMYVSHRFVMSVNFLALKQLCQMRMQTTEMQDTVAFAWLLREEIKKEFPLLANYLRPLCDNIKRDTTVLVNGFADMLGLPHDSDNRWQSDLKQYKILNKEPCTNIREIEKCFNIKVPKPTSWINYTYEKLDEKDKKRFMKK